MASMCTPIPAGSPLPAWSAPAWNTNSASKPCCHSMRYGTPNRRSVARARRPRQWQQGVIAPPPAPLCYYSPCTPSPNGARPWSTPSPRPIAASAQHSSAC
ncbi:exported hypothetical protein [Stenotrophomonas indicatrix]|nr:exported hypothetical protein [Stenotrophomonas indicatrix]